jgi:two-component sensor histidine kinase/CheY-like chemotaxis protein
MKLVIVDDIAINRKLLRVTLEAEGHTALEASDGIEALQVLSRERVDGVISDILMPRMDGYRLCNEIRANRHLRDLPFVFYTATFVSAVDEQMARNVGADKYLTKPASVETILAALNEAATIQHAKPVPGAVHEIEVLRVYSDRLVTKLEETNIELERELRMSALSIDVGAALMYGKTLGEILQRCCRAMVQHLDTASAAIWTYNEAARTLDWQAGEGLAKEPVERTVAIGQYWIGVVARERKPRIIERAARERCVPEQENMPQDALESFACYPLVIGQRVLGVIALFARKPFSDAALDRIASVADSIALGVDRKRSEEELRGALAEKTTLLQEVHHRVKNNLQVICSLLSMQIECSGTDLSTGPLADAHARVIAVSLIHEQIYQSDKLGDLDFGEYIGRLSGSVFAAYCIDRSRTDMELSIDPLRLTVEEAIPCGLILNELLSNTLKHAFKDGRRGLVRISLRKSPSGYVELTVADNGIGFPPDFRWAEGRSLGLKVVQALVKQLRGNLSVSGENGAMFRFGWQLPNSEAAVDVDQADLSSSPGQAQLR